MSLTNKVLFDIDQSSYPSEQKAIARNNIGAYEDKTTAGGIPKSDLASDVKTSLGKADSSVQGVKVNGTELSKDGNNKVDVPVPTASTATPLKDGTASAGSSSQWARGDHVHPTDDSREAVANKVQSIDDSSTTEYPSSKAVADFVNSSVATNTANFLGTIAESSLGLDYTATNEQIALALNVHSWESTPTNNDYCFVSVNDPQTTDVDEYRRFKFNGSVWAYEYTLNNSSFTQAQWNAINSCLTSSDRTAYNAAVTLLNSHVGDGSIHVTAEQKTAWTAKQEAVSTDTDSSAFGDNTAIATGFSSDKLHLNVASRLWNYIRGKILGWYDWTRVDSGTGRYAKICSIADPASGTSYTVDVLVTHMTSYYAVTGLVRIAVSHGSSSVQASILASDSLFYAVDSGNPPKVYTYVDSNGKRTFVFDTASAYQTAQGFVFRAVGGFSDKWSFFGDVGCSNDAANLGSIGTKQDALDVTFVFAAYAKTAGHAETATSADNATEAASVPWSGVNARPSTMCSPYFDASTTGRYYKMLSTNGVQNGSSCHATLKNAFAGFCISLQFRVYTTSVMVDAYFTQLGVYARNIFETNGYPVVRAYKNGDNDISFILDMGAGYAENGITNCIADFSGVTDRDDYWFWEFEQQGYTSVQSSWGTEMTASPFSILKDNTAYYAETAGNASTVNGHSVGKDVPSNAVFTDTDTKVTSAANHYSPSRDSSADKSASASGGSASWSMDVVKGVTLQTDGKGHVTGINVSSGKVPANPFDPSGTYSNMTVGNASKVNNHTVDKDVPSNAVFTDTTYSRISRGSGAGLAPGLPSGSGTSKYLREDGTWQTPTNTWKLNDFSNEGYVKKGEGHYDCVWGTNSNGAPDWQELANLSVGYANSADSASYATGASNYAAGGTISTRFNNIDSTINTLTNNLASYSSLGFRHWVFSNLGTFTPDTKGKKVDSMSAGTATTKRKIGMETFFIGNNTGSDMWCELRVKRTHAVTGTSVTVTFITKLFSYCYVPITIPMDAAHFSYEFWIYKNANLATGSITVMQDSWMLTSNFENSDE